MARTTTYYVWRRDDGYVGATAYNPIQKDAFEILLTTTLWSEARDAIVANRDERHFSLVASWRAGGQ